VGLFSASSGATLSSRPRTSGSRTTFSKNREEYYVRMNWRVRELLLEVNDRGGFTQPEDYVFCLGNGGRLRSIHSSFDRAKKRQDCRTFTFTISGTLPRAASSWPVGLSTMLRSTLGIKARLWRNATLISAPTT
jgi:hypothetical protein